MADLVYYKVGTTLRLPFHLQLNGAPITGVSSFAIRIAKNGTGNQATTGVTVSEIDSTNNPGDYELAANATTSFVAATGTYQISLRGTSGSDYVYAEASVKVTEDGTGSSCSGAAQFTASVGDGRVTDGTSAISGATVYFKTAGGVLVTQVDTDASGLYTVYLDETVTGYAQKDGYTQEAFTITVSGSTATGPGADVALSATTTSASLLTLSDLLSYAKRQAKLMSGSISDTILTEAVNDALLMLGSDHEWSWLFGQSVINLHGDYNTGTVAITKGTNDLVLAGGTWPTWAAYGELRIGEKLYTVASRTNDTDLVLDDDFGETTLTAGTYVIYQDSYDLPTDCIEVISVTKGANWVWGDAAATMREHYEAKSQANVATSTPEFYAIGNGKLWLFGYPTEDADINIFYRKRITKLVNSTDSCNFDLIHEGLLHRAIDYHVALRYGETAGGQKAQDAYNEYRRCLAGAITRDRSARQFPSAAGHSRGRRIGLTPLPDAP